MTVHFALSEDGYCAWCCLVPREDLGPGELTRDWGAVTCPKFGQLKHTVYVDAPWKRAAVRRIFPGVVLVDEQERR